MSGCFDGEIVHIPVPDADPDKFPAGDLRLGCALDGAGHFNAAA